jgi:YfiH family protein
LLRKTANGIVTYHFESLPLEGIIHAVFTRLGGVSQGPFATLNVGSRVGDDEASVAENHARIYAHLGLSPDRVTSPYQIHGNRVVIVTADDAGRVIQNADGLITDTPGVALLLRFADCQPVLLYDPGHHAVGLIHAGWRGVAQGIVRRAVEAMHDAFDTRAEELVAGLGPAIGPCCYTVGHSVAAAMGYALPDWSQVMSLLGEDEWRFDLSAANAQQLVAEGVTRIEQAGLCTACHEDEFYSHRGDNGCTGRFAVVVFLDPTVEWLVKEGRAAKEDRHTGAVDAQVRRVRPEDGYAQGGDVESLNPPGFPTFDQLSRVEP